MAPLQKLLSRWAGVETTVALSQDHPEEFEATFAAIELSQEPLVEVLAASPAEVVILPENLASQVVGESFFRRFDMPYYRKIVERLHAAGKIVAIHIDGGLKPCLGLLSTCGFDIAEAVTPAPFGDLGVEELRKAAGPDIVLWGGLPGGIFSRNYSDRFFEEYVVNVLRHADHRFVLGVADQVPPDAVPERIGRVRELVDCHSQGPRKGMRLSLEQTEGIALRMQGVSKRFPGTLAVDNIDFDLRAGEVHALVGENGAGKSTLMKMLAGAFDDYTGSIFLDGRQVRLSSPAVARQNGIAMIYQELSLAHPLSVAENVLAGRLPVKGLLLDRREIARQTRQLLERVGLEDLDPLTEVGQLCQHEMQLIEIAKALGRDPRIIVMDEPTSALTREEVERLFRIIGALKASGLAIIYISHHLPEIFQVADRVTVMRDGRKIGTYAGARGHRREAGGADGGPHGRRDVRRCEHPLRSGDFPGREPLAARFFPWISPFPCAAGRWSGSAAFRGPAARRSPAASPASTRWTAAASS